MGSMQALLDLIVVWCNVGAFQLCRVAQTARLLALHAYLHADSAAEQAPPVKQEVKPLVQVSSSACCIVMHVTTAGRHVALVHVQTAS